MNQTTGGAQVRVCENADAVAEAALEVVVAHARQAVAEHGAFSLALSGGSTPARLFSLLARPEHAARIDWSRVHVFWADERCVPPEHPDSNYGMARELLLQHVPCPAGSVHRMMGELAPDEAAHRYEGELAALPGELDLILLGMGADGHTASLFPGTEALMETRRRVVANHVRKLSAWRITLTYPALNSAAAVAFLVTGADKAPMAARALGRATGPKPPAGFVQPASRNLTWLLDPAAAQQAEPDH